MRTAKTCGPDVPMLASTVATVHGSPGRARYKPESHCAGNVVCSPLPCMLMRALLVHVAHEIAGAARIRHSLRPLDFRGREILANLGRIASRGCKGASILLRHSGARVARARNPSYGRVSGSMDSGPAPSGASRNDKSGT